MGGSCKIDNKCVFEIRMSKADIPISNFNLFCAKRFPWLDNVVHKDEKHKKNCNFYKFAFKKPFLRSFDILHRSMLCMLVTFRNSGLNYFV